MQIFQNKKKLKEKKIKNFIKKTIYIKSVYLKRELEKKILVTLSNLMIVSKIENKRKTMQEFTSQEIDTIYQDAFYSQSFKWYQILKSAFFYGMDLVISQLSVKAEQKYVRVCSRSR